MTLPVSTLYVSLFGLMLIALAVPVVIKRWRLKIGIGAGQHMGFERTMRAHQNFTEYVPLALLLLVIAELNGTAHGVLHAAGATLLVGRVLHAAGLSRYAGVSFGRSVGTTATWLVIIALALINLYRLL